MYVKTEANQTINPNFDTYLLDGCGRCPLGGTPGCKVHLWPEVLVRLRTILLNCGLTEEIKWGVPCYTFRDSNVVLLGAMKEYVALGFFKGALLKDPSGKLTKPGKHSQAVRQLRFTSTGEIMHMRDDIEDYVRQAMEVEKAGLKISLKKNPEPFPEELQEKLDEDPVFRTAFETLTPGRQRGYIIHFSQPKQSKTRQARIEKWTGSILNGEGMHDQYRSKRQQTTT